LRGFFGYSGQRTRLYGPGAGWEGLTQVRQGLTTFSPGPVHSSLCGLRVCLPLPNMLTTGSRTMKMLITTASLLLSTLVAAQVQWNEMPLTEGTFGESEVAYNQAEFEILVPAGAGPEFKIAMQAGDTVVYSWTADIADPSLMDVEFHGHTDPVDGEGDLMFYKVHNDRRESGTLTAPFTGIHGWWLNNRSDRDVTVQLSIAGFFTVAE